MITEIKELQKICLEVRRDIIRMLGEAGSGHPGGSLSAVELVVSLYFSIMRHKPEEPDWENRDRFILSKGHCCPLLYAVLAKCGYFPSEKLLSLRKLGSPLQGHPHNLEVPGVEASTGSLGQGLSIANGIALAGRLDKKNYRVYCLLGDGETDEGQIWEAAMTANHYHLDNLCAIVDRNRLQIDGETKNIMQLEPYREKWEAFGWKVIEIDGNNLKEISEAYVQAEKIKSKPTVIIARTIKGKGVSYMENRVEWHGKAPKKEEEEKALKELGKTM